MYHINVIILFEIKILCNWMNKKNLNLNSFIQQLYLYVYKKMFIHCRQAVIVVNTDSKFLVVNRKSKIEKGCTCHEKNQECNTWFLSYCYNNLIGLWKGLLPLFEYILYISSSSFYIQLVPHFKWVFLRALNSSF